MGDLQKVTIQPFDFEVADDASTHVRGLWALYRQGDQILFVPMNEPCVLVIDPETKKVRRIGRNGDGPGEFGGGHPRALSSGVGSMWVLDHKLRVSYFTDDVFHTSFKVKSYQIAADSYPKYAFAHNESFVVIPAFPASGFLANVYDYSGQVVEKVGGRLPVDTEMLQWNPAVNNTIWRFLDGKWYCLFTYRPTIRIFSDQFELIKELQVIGPEVDIYEERFHRMAPDPNFPEVRPHFTDFQVTNTNIYLMCNGVLYRMDHEGKVESRTGFFGNEEIVSEIGFKPRVEFTHAIVMKSGRVYLGVYGNYFDHDLWFVDLER